MSQQFKLTIPLPPEGSVYVKEFNEYFKSIISIEQWTQLKAARDNLKVSVENNIRNLEQQIVLNSDPLTHTFLVGEIRKEHRRYTEFHDNVPLAPTLDEISGMVVLSTYFLSEEDSCIALAEMKSVILKRFKSCFPNVDKDSLLATQEQLDNVFKSVEAFYRGNPMCHEYLVSLMDRYAEFVPQHIGRNIHSGLDLYLYVDEEPPKLTFAEAKAMEAEGIRLNGYSIIGNIPKRESKRTRGSVSWEQAQKNHEIAQQLIVGL